MSINIYLIIIYYLPSTLPECIIIKSVFIWQLFSLLVIGEPGHVSTLWPRWIKGEDFLYVGENILSSVNNKFIDSFS